MGWTCVCVEQRCPPLEQRLLWKRNGLPLQKVLQVWEGLVLVLRVSEVQLTMQRTSSARPPPPPEGIPRQRQPLAGEGEPGGHVG